MTFTEAGSAKAGHGSLVLLYRSGKKIKPLVLIWVTPKVCFARRG